MLDSDTLPVDHDGNSEGPSRKFPPWLLGVVLPPLVGTAAGHAQEPSRLLVGLAGGVGVSVLWVAAVAWRDYRRVRVARQIQDEIEDAWTAHAKGESARAEDLLRATVKLAGEKLGRYDLITLACLHTLGNLLRLRRDHAGANSCYEQALPIYKKILPSRHPARAAFHQHRAETLEELGRTDEALEQVELACGIYRELGNQEFALADACSLLGRIATTHNQDDLALKAFSEALELLRTRLPVNDPRVLQAMSNLCRVYAKLRRFQESEKFLLELVEQHRQQPDLQPENFLDSLIDLSSLRLEQSRQSDAEPLLVEALQLLQTRVGPKERPLQRILEAYRRITRESNLVDISTTHGMVNMVLVFCGEREKLRQTLEKFPLWMNARDSTGWGPLHWAAFVGREDIIRWLISKGAEVNRPEDPVSALHIAAAWGKRECVLELLEAGADLNVKDPKGWTPVFWCAFSGRHKLLEVLIKRGADVNVRDDHGKTPLHIAAEQGHLAAVATLVGSGAVVMAKEADGASPLHLAARRGNLAVCECLVFNQGDLNARDGQGKNAIELARHHQHRLLHRVLRRLQRAGLGRGRVARLAG